MLHEIPADAIAARAGGASRVLNPTPGQAALALALVLAGVLVWISPREGHGRRAQGRPLSDQGLPPRRRLGSRSTWAQGALTAMMSLKFGKLFISGSGVLVSLVGYALLWGWWFAAGFVLLMFVHELGHVAAARLRGLQVSALTFIPFLGAYVLRERTSDPATEFQVALAGPLVGSLAAFATLRWAVASGSELGVALAYSGFVLNLFNLAPVPGLDGGTITTALSPRVWLAGLPILIAVVALQFEPLLLLVGVLALPHAVEAWRTSAREPRYWFSNRLDSRSRAVYAAAYFGLICVLAVTVSVMHHS